jgi:hypothetical protein
MESLSLQLLISLALSFSMLIKGYGMSPFAIPYNRVFQNGENVKIPKCEINAIEFAYVAYIFRTEQRHLVYIC